MSITDTIKNTVHSGTENAGSALNASAIREGLAGNEEKARDLTKDGALANAGSHLLEGDLTGAAVDAAGGLGIKGAEALGLDGVANTISKVMNVKDAVEGVTGVKGGLGQYASSAVGGLVTNEMGGSPLATAGAGAVTGLVEDKVFGDGGALKGAAGVAAVTGLGYAAYKNKDKLTEIVGSGKDNIISLKDKFAQSMPFSSGSGMDVSNGGLANNVVSLAGQKDKKTRGGKKQFEQKVAFGSQPKGPMGLSA